MAPVTTKKSGKPACRRRRSSSKSVEIPHRTRYHRLCRGKFPVKYVESSEPATRMKKSARTCRKLTERRKSLIRAFMDDFLVKPHNYATYGTENWISSLLTHINEGSKYGLAAEDVQMWIRKEEFFTIEMVNRLPKHSISEDQVERQHKRMPRLIPIHAILDNQFDHRHKKMPRLIPLPTSGGANSREALPSNPHTDSVGLPAVTEEVREQRVMMKTSSETNPLSDHPPKKKSKPKDTSAVSSTFERCSPGSYNTAAVLRVQQLENFFKRLFESIDNIKASVFSPETLRFEGLCYAADSIENFIE